MQDYGGDLCQHLNPGLYHCEIGQKSLIAGLQTTTNMDLAEIFREGHI